MEFTERCFMEKQQISFQKKNWRKSWPICLLALLSCFVFANLADAKSQISRQQDALSACPGEYVTDSLLASDGSI
ncbi:MAG: hypothetical protein RR138_07670, partial [Akkermansia sp.]